MGSVYNLSRVKLRKLRTPLFNIVILLFMFFGSIGTSAVVDPTIKLDDLPAPYSFIVKTDGANYWGVKYTGQIFYEDTNASVTIQGCIDALTSGGTIFLQELELPDTVTYGDDILIIENYQGSRKIYSNLGSSLLQQLASDPSTGTWGASEQGRWWYNTGEDKIKFWDGSTVQILPSVSGGGSYTLPPEYVIYKSGSTYYAEDSEGNIDYSGSNASQVTNDAIGTFTHSFPQTVAFKGNLTYTSPILVENYTILDCTDAQLNLGDNCDLIKSASTVTHSVSIYGGIFNGWNYTGNAVHFNVSDLMPSWRSVISGTTIKFFVGDGLSLRESGSRFVASNMYIYNCTRGVYANSPDNKFNSIVVGDCGHEAWYISGSSNVLTGVKGYGSGKSDITKGSGIVFYGRNSQVTGSLFQENYKYGAEIKSIATAISLVGNTYDRNSLGSANTYDGVYVAGSNVSITGGIVKNLYGKSQTQRHGVYFDSTASNCKMFGVVEHNLLGELYVKDPGATDILIDEELGSGDGDGESVANRAWSFMCWKNATATYVTSGSTGEIVYNNVSPTLAFEWAFGQCGGTIQEKVVIKGSYNNLLQIDLDTAHVTVEILGYLHLAVGQSPMFDISTTADFAEFCGGGTIDPNGDSQSSTTHGLLFTSVDDCSVHHLYFTSGYGTSGSGDTIRFAECERCSVHDCEFRPYQESYDSVKIRGTGSHDNIVTDNILYIDDGCNSAGIQLSNGAYRNTVSNNYIYVYDTLTDHASAIKLHDADYNLITGNHIYMDNNPWGGIDVIQDGDYNQIIGNWIQGGDRCIWFRETTTNTPIWNAIIDNFILLRDADGTIGIELDHNDNTVVQGNTIICMGTTGTQYGIHVESDCTDSLIKNNNFDVLIDTNVWNEAGTETEEIGSEELNYS